MRAGDADEAAAADGVDGVDDGGGGERGGRDDVREYDGARDGGVGVASARAAENGTKETRGARESAGGDAAGGEDAATASEGDVETGGGGEGAREDAADDAKVVVKPKKPPNQSRENRRVRQYRSASDITQEELSSCFHLPSEAACRKLGVGLTVLKRQCRKYGIKRWPFRKMKSLDRLITNVQAGISPGDQNRLLVKSVEELEDQKRKMEECAVLDLDDTTKRLQQAYSKANHKARRNRSDAARIRAQAAQHAMRAIERRTGGSFNDPESASDSLMALQRHLVNGDVDEGSPDGTPEAAPAANTPAAVDVRKDESAAKVLLSNTPVDATVKDEANYDDADADANDDADDDAKDTEKVPAKATSNVMVRRDGTTTRDYAGATEKVLTAVRGAWSPARPAKRLDAQDDAEAFLSPTGKIRGSLASKKDLQDVAAWNVPIPIPTKPRGRGRPPGPSKRGRKRKTEDIDDDDPLASLAAAALDSMGTTKPSGRGAGAGRGRPSASGDKDGKFAASKFKPSAPAVTEDHPAFGLAPAVKGQRSGAQSRLSQVERSDLQNLLHDRLVKGKSALCEAFEIVPADFDRYFNPKLQAASLAGAIEKLASKSSNR